MSRSFPAEMPQSGSCSTRRQFLNAAAAVGATVMLTRAGARAADEKTPYIDAHSHIWTRDVKHFPLREGTTVDDLKPASFTTQELLQTCRPHGVGRVVLIAHHLYYGFDNSYMTDSAKRYPGVFRVVGMIDDQKPHPDAAMRKLLPKKVTGFRITSWVNPQTWLENPGMQLMWRTAAQTRQAMCCLINPEDLPRVDRMCEKHPDTPVVIDHFARIGVDGEIHEKDLKQLCRLARHKNTHVKISAYYALGAKKPPYLDLVPMIRRLYEVFGPERLMWASDSPYQLEGDNTYGASIALVRDKLDFVTAADNEWLLRKTAEKVYFYD